ncbi:PREDICTED: embryonic stem cell-specific 5-hydroxymethylcytosine-binding protein [Ceratosolen solmsi marchali]|uniref:Abasic site processing protein HMCES n=1 Tax=Ceratosolen solmsi marchali TaxID=326594 RepID=A0AAJ7E230_9HYME|nr:PREDICTED: embryonic stem cell-specific 5-hydroxymethylcytosine-binding protein [Ceratosolen solmsi marchali]
MCRFCFCELSKEQLSKRCAYKKNDIEHDIPWNNDDIFVDYQPSNILQPKSNSLPVIVNGLHLQKPEDPLFCPMYWNFIPHWYKDDINEWKGVTHNARIENIYENKIYSASLKQGKRCVVVMEGFFEFKKTGTQPAEVYYLHSSDNNLLKAAGLFSTTKLHSGEILRSCTVITTESHNNLRKIHHRMPLLLNRDADFQSWLDFKNVSPTDAVTQIKANCQNDLKFYKTSKMGSRELQDTKKNVGSKSIMSNWLKTESNKGVKRKAND